MKEDKYDVVIIGSGMGGMCTAALLAHKGYKVLVTERLPQLGGRCSTINYKGFKLSTGAISIEMGGVLEDVFREVGAEFDVHLHPQPYYRIKGKDYELPERGGLKKLIAYAANDTNELERVLQGMRLAMTWSQPSNSFSLRDWLLQYTDNEAILGIFQAMIPMMHCININEIPAGEFFHFVKVGYRFAGVANGGNVKLMESLSRSIEGNGGTVWTHCPAKQILTANHLAKGVVVQKDGKEIEIPAQVVISNTGPNKTVELAGRDNFDPGYLKELKETMRPAPYVIVYAVSEKPIVEYPGNLLLTEGNKNLFLGTPTLLSPELAPPGKHLLMAGAPLTNSLVPFNLEKEIDLVVQDMADFLPDFKKYGELLFATCLHSEWPVYHTWSGYNVPQKTPVENLYNVGDGVRPPGSIGVPSTARSARIVVDDLVKRVSPQS